MYICGPPDVEWDMSTLASPDLWRQCITFASLARAVKKYLDL